MADVRALLKAKRQEARITHPYAVYNASGQLKCSVCSSIVKHASAWEGHLGSKLHRTNVARMREEEQRQREQQKQGSEDPEPEMTGKRKTSTDAETPAEKRRKVDEKRKAHQGFPQDFFSDPSRAPVTLSADSDEESDGEAEAPQPPVSTNTVDLEYERFQRELLATTLADPTEAYDRATVIAEPVAASTEVAGFPVNAPEAAETEPVEFTADELRQKREQEDRELIMDRLLQEERAQEDADTRVQLLRTKLDGLRKKRELAKARKVVKG